MSTPTGPRHHTPHMTAGSAYAALSVVGTVLPLWQFFPFLTTYGLDLQLFVAQLFATPVSGFFGVDVLVSSLVLWTFVAVEGRRAGMRRLWVPVLANLTVGVSLGLPLFLYMRERHLVLRDRSRAAGSLPRGAPPGDRPDDRATRPD